MALVDRCIRGSFMKTVTSLGAVLIIVFTSYAALAQEA
jgi:hypothetical protein